MRKGFIEAFRRGFIPRPTGNSYIRRLNRSKNLPPVRNYAEAKVVARAMADAKEAIKKQREGTVIATPDNIGVVLPET